MCVTDPTHCAQADLMADDIDIDFAKMSLWTEDQATAFFESGGTLEPAPAQSLPALALPLPAASQEEFVKWFPKTHLQGAHIYQQPPRFRMVCLHAAGCSESMWTGNGLRVKEENPFVQHCKAAGGDAASQSRLTVHAISYYLLDCQVWRAKRLRPPSWRCSRCRRRVGGV